MPQDKMLTRIEAKIDALLAKAGMDNTGFETKLTTPAAPKLTPQEQEAIDNAPEALATIPPGDELPRLTAQNAPSTKSSVPPAADAKKSKGEPNR